MESKKPPEPNKASPHQDGGGKICIHITFVGFPKIYDFFQKDHINYYFSGNTLRDLVDDLIVRYGQQVKDSLWDERINRLDPCIQIVLNEKDVTSGDLRYVKLSEGDQVTFLRLLAGG